VWASLCLALVALAAPRADAVDAAVAAFKAAASPSHSKDDRVHAVEAVAKSVDSRVATALIDETALQALREADLRKQLDDIAAKLAPLQGWQLQPDQWAQRDHLESERKKASEKLSAEEAVTRAIVEALAAWPGGDALAPVLAAARKHTDAFVRAKSLAAISRTSDDAVTQAIVGSLADKDPRVRVAALDAIALRRDRSLFDSTAACLRDESWPVRSAAIGALAAMGDVRAVEPLLPLLDKEEGRLRDDLVKALEGLTHEKLGFNPPAWRDWWKAHGTPTDAPAAPSAPAPRPASTAGKPATVKPPLTYHGIPTRSRSILFVVDISLSMREGSTDDVRGADGTANRENVKRSKFDVAMAELTRAINAVDEKGSFDVIFFNDAIEPWQPKLVPATRKNKDDAIALIKRTVPAGETNIFAALETAFKMGGFGATDKSYQPSFDTMFFLSDGAPSCGRITDVDEILKTIAEMNQLRKITIHTIGMGKLHHKKFMSALAAQNGGTYIALE
jgi:HEAT repeat protein/VWA domain-containing protein